MSIHALEVSSADVLKMRDVAPDAPRVAVVLGSGLTGLADAVDGAVRLSHGELETVPRVSAVAGHAGALVFGSLADTPVVLFAGRVHQYQGVSARDAAFPARIAAALGCETLIVTNAAGGVAERLSPGDIMLITDHLNLMGTNPLTGWPGPPDGVPFVPMTDAYDPQLQAIALQSAAEEVISITEGVYAGLLGPSYETPAEVAMLRALGADVVGMSTVPEVIAARALGLRVLGFSLVTNVAAGSGLSHAEVLEAGERASAELTRLVLAILRRL